MSFKQDANICDGCSRLVSSSIIVYRARRHAFARLSQSHRAAHYPEISSHFSRYSIPASRGINGNLRTAISSKEATQEFMVAATAIQERIPYGYQG